MLIVKKLEDCLLNKTIKNFVSKQILKDDHEMQV